MNFIKPKFWKNNNILVYFLLPLTIITKIIILLKNNQQNYDPKIATICIGNIYLGGTGKTQLVLKINQFLKKKYKTFVIKKYYKNQFDEQQLLKKRTRLILPKNRLEGLKKIDKSKTNLAIFDDGLQDKSIKYSLSIVCFNSISGIGNGKLLPAGPLRESLSKLNDYDAVFINGNKNINLLKSIKNHNDKIKIFEGKYFLSNKKDFDKKSKFLAICGLGTPEGFFNLLEENGICIKKKIIFPDHYDYKASDINYIRNFAKSNNLKIVTSEKDYIKLKKFKKLNVMSTIIDLKINKFANFKKFLQSHL